MAFLIPLALVLLCLVKKLTVIGIIGNTQGVSKAAKPDKKAIKKIVYKLESESADFRCFSTIVLTSVFAVFFVYNIGSFEFLLLQAF